MVDGRVLPGPVGTRAGNVAQVGQDPGVQMDCPLKVEGNVRTGGKAVRAEEQVEQGWEVGLGQAAANIDGDVAGVEIDMDEDTELVVGKFVAQGNLHEKYQWAGCMALHRLYENVGEVTTFSCNVTASRVDIRTKEAAGVPPWSFLSHAQSR
jgi:hypothetical protein